jgi:Na+/H+ antiporter NhaD/arsenite permease-like protein
VTDGHVVETREDQRDPHVPDPKNRTQLVIYAVAILAALALAVTGRRTEAGIFVLGDIPFAFVLFVLVLLGVAFFHHVTLWVALAGAVVISLYTVLLARGHHWSPEQHRPGLWGHFLHEGEHTLLSLLGLLLGFALLAKFFEHSGVPDNLPRVLPKKPLLGAFTLLALVWVLSSFLDNIAAAMIGGVVARVAFRGRVSLAYVAGIVAASNAGGAWSVLGDTTTTMMWIADVPAVEVLHAIVASAAALLVFGFFSAARQNRLQPIVVDRDAPRVPIDVVQLLVVVLILAATLVANLALGLPAVGLWVAILLGSLVRRPAWGELPGAAKGAVFLLSLVWCASLMPVESLPAASWPTAFGLGFVSSVFDNIPLTKLALAQDGYDWGVLAFAVGFGGSMIWFGSSAGVAISKDFPEARSTVRYVREAWPVALAYVVGFFVLVGTLGWHAHPIRPKPAATPPAATAPADAVR